jgi:plastocyanin
MLVATIALGACGDKAKVGSGVNTNFDDKVGQRLGEATTTTAGATATTVAGPAGGRATVTTAAAAHTATTAAIKYQEVVLSANGFDTNPIRVYVGTPIRFTNKDTKTRTISGANGEFDSGPIAPNAQFVFTPHAAAAIDVATDVPFHTTHIDAINR